MCLNCCCITCSAVISWLVFNLSFPYLRFIYFLSQVMHISSGGKFVFSLMFRYLRLFTFRLSSSNSIINFSNQGTVSGSMPSLDELAKTPQNINEWFLSICAHVAESRRVIEELSKEDPPTEPFKSKYAGRNMLKSALQRAQSFQPSTDQETSRIRCAQATIFLYIGMCSSFIRLVIF